MAYLNMKVKVLKVDERRMKQIIRRHMAVQLRQALRAFIRAAAPRIPVDTGMSKGSLFHIGRILRVSVPIKPRKTRTTEVNGKIYKLDNTNLKYQYSPGKGQIKNPELGAQLTKINNVRANRLNKQNLFKGRSTTQTITFDSSIFQLNLHGDRWGALDAGRAAFVHYMLNIAPTKMPGLQELLVEATMSVRGTKHSKGAFKPVKSSGSFRRG